MPTTREVFYAAVAAIRTADAHVRDCGPCRTGAGFGDMCAQGQQLTYGAAAALKETGADRAGPLPGSSTWHTERTLRDRVHADLLYYADRMEANHPDRADVRRDAHEVRRAARVARDGLGECLFTGCVTEAAQRYIDEISRLRAVLRQERALRAAAEERADAPGQEDSGPGDAAAPAGAAGLCPQNRTGNFIRVEEPVTLGEHFFNAGEAAACVYCGTRACGGGEPGTGPRVPEYVFNARSVNRTTKHFAHPGDAAFTLCPSAFVASAPMSSEDAARLPLCGGCRRTATGLKD